MGETVGVRDCGMRIIGMDMTFMPAKIPAGMESDDFYTGQNGRYERRPVGETAAVRIIGMDDFYTSQNSGRYEFR